MVFRVSEASKVARVIGFVVSVRQMPSDHGKPSALPMPRGFSQWILILGERISA